MKSKERREVRLLKEAIDGAILSQIAEKQPKPSVRMNKNKEIKISVLVDAIPIFKEEQEDICDYLRDKWLVPSEDSECENIAGDYFVIRKCFLQNKYKVSAKSRMGSLADDCF